jgi:predicted nucleic acid-binding protein
VPRSFLLLDACVAINLAATDRLQHIAEILDVTFVLTGQAAAEVGYLRDVIRGELVTTPVSISQHASAGTVQLIDLDAPEYPLYLELAAIVDDGEAATIAVAAHRGIQLATDDRKARRLCDERQVREPLRTLALVHAYTDTARLETAYIRALLLKIRNRASYQPPRSDPDHKWWTDHIEGI